MILGQKRVVEQQRADEERAAQQQRADEERAAQQQRAAAEQMQFETQRTDSETAEESLPAGVLAHEQSIEGEHSIAYVKNDGSMLQTVSGAPVNYYDAAAGKYLRADNTLTEREGKICNAANAYAVRFEKQATDGKLMTLEKNGCSIGMSCVGLDERHCCHVESCQGKCGKVKVKGIRENADAEYIVEANGIKENIIVHGRADSYEYDFTLAISNLEVSLSEDSKSIELRNKQSGEREFTIPSPFMTDANGVYSDSVYYEIDYVTDDVLSIKVAADKSFIDEETRAFPVTIDPQIISSNSSVIDKECFCRYYSTSSGSSSAGSWYNIISDKISVKRQSNMEVKTHVLIRKSKISLSDKRIVGVKLLLQPYATQYCRIYIDGNYYYVNATGTLSVDITSRFKDSSGDLEMVFAPYESGVMEFHFSGENAPILEIEYLTNENTRPQKRTFSLADAGECELDLATGEATAKFIDTAQDRTLTGGGIYHVYKKNTENFFVGENFRLNLHETFVRNSSSAFDANYIYTDAEGRKHGFKDYFYYLNASNNKVSVSRSSVTAELDGSLSYTVSGKKYEVKAEYKTCTGLKALPKIEGFKGAELVEQRSDEMKTLQEQTQAYKNALQEYVVIQTSTGAIVRSFTAATLEKSAFDSFANITATQMALPKAEALAYKGLKLQEDSATNQINSLNLQTAAMTNQEEAMQYQYVSMGYQLSAMELQCDSLIFEYNKTQDSEERQNVMDRRENVTSQHSVLKAQRSNTSEQQTDLTNQKNSIGAVKSNTLSAKANTTAQITAIVAKRELYIKQLKDYYREYSNNNFKLQSAQRQMPVSFLTDGTVYKGYNSDGRLVAVYDNYDNSLIIEYENSPTGGGKQRIKRVYDSANRETVFAYNKSGLLCCITEFDGRKTQYVYTGGRLTQIKQPGGKTVTLTYAQTTANSNLHEVTSSDKLKTTLSYYGGKLSRIGTRSTVSKITGSGTEGSGGVLSEISAEYTQNADKMQTVTISEDTTVDRYFFDANNNLSAMYTEQNAKVTQAQQIQYVMYSTDKRVNAKKSTLGITPLSDFTFVAGDSETTQLNRFNLPVTKTYSATDLTADGSNKQSATVTYEYDDEQRLVKECTLITTTNPVTAKTAVCEYGYNARGSLARKQSYVEGEELTGGIDIEEIYYDDNGNTVKTLSYNSLDSSSKFYTDRQVNEQGQVIGEIDETGENVTQIHYQAGTNTVTEKVLPNGIIQGCGRDERGRITAITQSDDNGAEGSTQTRYRDGLITELVSGGNSLRYEYDFKRRTTAVALNSNDAYATFEYAENVNVNSILTDKTLMTNANGEQFVSYTDKSGNVVQRQYGGVMQTESSYTKNMLTSLKDGVSGDTVNISYDALDRISGVNTVNAGNVAVSESCEYDSFGSLSKRTVQGAVSHSYTYAYKDNLARDCKSVTVSKGGVTMQQGVKHDALGRVSESVVSTSGGEIAGEYRYYRKQGDRATTMPVSLRYGSRINGKYTINEGITYTYDNMGNISNIYSGNRLLARYGYDGLGRLVREDNSILSKTCLYSYDANGNIVTRTQSEYTLKDKNEIAGEWKDYCYLPCGDRLSSYEGKACEYDAVGNPTLYLGKAAVWTKGRQLTSLGDTTYSYNGRGQRTTKNGISYVYDSEGRVLKQSDGIEYVYDGERAIGIIAGEDMYVYRRNAQGDITALLDNNGNVVVRYVYDAWGGHKVLSGTYSEENVPEIGHKNPLRYRGYYYDTETGLYYLQTRYYDPETGRFINADDISVLDYTNGIINGLNLYVYCFNDPVNASDHGGDMPNWLKQTLLSLFVPGYALGGLIGGMISAAHGTGFSSGFSIGGITGSIITGLAITILLTGGATAGLSAAFGGGFIAAVGAGAIVSGISGAIICGGMNLLTQGLSNGYANINWGAVGRSALIGGISGAIMGGSFAAIGRGIGALGNVKYFQNRPNTFMFGGRSGNNMTIFKIVSKFRFEADLVRGFHAHFKTLTHGLSYHRTVGIVSGWNAIVGFGSWGIFG